MTDESDKPNIVHINDKDYFLVDGPPFGGSLQHVCYALAVHDLGSYIERHQVSAVAQFYKLVIPTPLSLQWPLCMNRSHLIDID